MEPDPRPSEEDVDPDDAQALSRATGVVAKSENFAYAINDVLGDIDV